VLEALSHWTAIAKELGVKPSIFKMISKQFDEVYQQNKYLVNG